ncbi:hypothetical protein [Streptomyces acidiscabies]|uniref:Uncharacterized protein n=1 Tax=Streptomyces acidiscabies TaxID=42234 RepID=A0AAP6B7A4_9ACTN|nr:hypothetical protein [Streptomyces acidiscabies]MBP5939683.1 hypothetical protein [Streptomyces sp. LBUM 1476]MBZ3910857.1 hypothetical protein [Streptomyces acidiscabies]MDX2959363.1 hypothetical protein [Streptomyces acidiscabies]MDX3017493.1 hypothetical protein [Streptomyces acidiscabies]MDX3787969.1 hypothetical protein [Streptomyces acidiscabies]
MPRRTPEEVRAAEAEFIEQRESVIERYKRGESAAALSRKFRVRSSWITHQLRTWGVEVRDSSAAGRVNGAGGWSH